jgi:hypothetical protein
MSSHVGVVLIDLKILVLFILFGDSANTGIPIALSRAAHVGRTTAHGNIVRAIIKAIRVDACSPGGHNIMTSAQGLDLLKKLLEHSFDLG